ncbi:MAG: DUF1761 domain-containing protein [Bacteroidota bacterium]
MDIASAFTSLNWFAVIAAALSSFLIGGLWYTIFQRAWLQAAGLSPDTIRQRNMPLVFGISLVLSFIIALNLALFIGKEGLSFGIIAGFMAGFGWVTLAIGIIAAFEKRPLKYVLINGGYMLIAFTVMGGILGLWK